MSRVNEQFITSSCTDNTIIVYGALRIVGLIYLCSLVKAASWNSLLQGGVTVGEANEELQKKVTTLEEEVGVAGHVIVAYSIQFMVHLYQ